MKYSKSAIGLLTAQYRSVLKKCWMINVGLFALGGALLTATPAEAEVPLAVSSTVPLADGSGGTYTVNSNIGTATLTSEAINNALGTVAVANANHAGSADTATSATTAGEATYASKIKLNAGGEATIESYFAKATDYSALIAGTTAFNTLKVGTVQMTGDATNGLTVGGNVTLGSTNALNIGSTKLSDGTLKLNGVNLSADSSAQTLSTAHFVASEGLKIGTSAEMKGVDTAAIDGHNTQLITSGAVATAINAAKAEAAAYTPATGTGAETYYGGTVTTISGALDKVGTDLDTLTGTGTGSISKKIESNAQDASFNKTSYAAGSIGAAIKANADDLTTLKGSGTGSISNRITTEARNAQFVRVGDSSSASLGTADTINVAINNVADATDANTAKFVGLSATTVQGAIDAAKSEASTFTADANLIASGKIYQSASIGGTTTANIGAALNAAGTQIELNKDAITKLNGDDTVTDSVKYSIKTLADGATHTKTNATETTIGAAINANEQAIADLNAADTNDKSVAYKIKNNAANATYASATDYTTGTIGAAIKANAADIKDNSDKLAGLKKSDGTDAATVQEAIDTARKGIASKTLNIGEDASEAVIGKALKNLKVGGDVISMTNKANADTTIAGKFTMDANGNVSLGTDAGGAVHGIKISESGNTVTFNGTNKNVTITDGAITADSATLSGLTLNGSSTVKVDKISSAAAITGTPDNDTLATTAAVKATVDTVSSALNDYATKAEVHGSADVTAVNLGEAAKTINVGTADAGVVVSNEAKSAEIKAKAAAGNNTINVDASGIKLGNQDGSTFDGLSYTKANGVVIGSDANTVTAKAGALTATGAIKGASVEGATLKATAATAGLTLNGTTADSIDNTGAAPTSSTKSGTILASTATVYNAMEAAKTAATAYDPSASILTKTTVQEAIDEAAGLINTNKTKSEANETKLAGLTMYDGTTVANTVQAALTDFKTNSQQYTLDNIKTGAQNAKYDAGTYDPGTIGAAIKDNADKIATLNGTGDGSVDKKITNQAENATFTDSTTAPHTSLAGATTINAAIQSVAGATDANTAKLAGLGDQTVAQAIAAAGTAADGKYVAKTYLAGDDGIITIGNSSATILDPAANVTVNTTTQEVAASVHNNSGKENKLTLTNNGVVISTAQASLSDPTVTKSVTINDGAINADGEVKAASFKIGDNDVTSIDSGAALDITTDVADADKKVMATDAAVKATVKALAEGAVKDNTTAITTLNGNKTVENSVDYKVYNNAKDAVYETGESGTTTIAQAIASKASSADVTAALKGKATITKNNMNEYTIGNTEDEPVSDVFYSKAGADKTFVQTSHNYSGRNSDITNGDSGISLYTENNEDQDITNRIELSSDDSGNGILLHADDVMHMTGTSEIRVMGSGAYYSKGTFNPTTDEIVTVGTAENAKYTNAAAYADGTIGKQIQTNANAITTLNSGKTVEGSVDYKVYNDAAKAKYDDSGKTIKAAIDEASSGASDALAKVLNGTTAFSKLNLGAASVTGTGNNFKIKNSDGKIMSQLLNGGYYLYNNDNANPYLTATTEQLNLRGANGISFQVYNDTGNVFTKGNITAEGDIKGANLEAKTGLKVGASEVMTGVDNGREALTENTASPTTLASAATVYTTVKANAEKATYTPATGQESAAVITAQADTINGAILALDENAVATNNAIGKIDNLHGNDNAMVNRDPQTGEATTKAANIVEAVNNISSTLGTIHGLKASVEHGDFDAEGSTWYKDGAGNLFAGSEVDDHLAELAASIGNRNYAAGTPYLTANESVATSLVALANNLKGVADNYVTKEYFNGGTATTPATISMGANASDIVIGHTAASDTDTGTTFDVNHAAGTITSSVVTAGAVGGAAPTTTTTELSKDGFKVTNGGKNVTIAEGNVIADAKVSAKNLAATDDVVVGTDGTAPYSKIEKGAATFAGTNKTVSIADGAITAGGDVTGANFVTAGNVTADGTAWAKTSLKLGAAGSEAIAIDNAGTVMTAAPTDDGKTLASTLTVYNNIHDATTVEPALRGNYAAGSVKDAVASIDKNMGNLSWYNGTHYANTGSTKTSLAAAIKNLDTNVFAKVGTVDLSTATNYANTTATPATNLTQAIVNMDANVKQAIDDLDDTYVTQDYFNNGDGTNNAISMGSGAKDITIGSATNNVVVDNANHTIGATIDTRDADEVLSTLTMDNTNGVKLATTKGLGSVAKTKNVAINNGVVTADDSFVASDTAEGTSSTIKSDGSATFKGANKTASITDGDITADDINAATVTATTITGTTVNATTLAMVAGGEATAIDNAGTVMTAAPTDDGKTLASTLTVYNNIHDATTVAAAPNGNYAEGSVKDAVASIDKNMGNLSWYNGTHYANTGSTKTSLAAAIKNMDTAIYGKLGDMNLTTATNYANTAAATDLTVTDAIKNIDTNVKQAIDDLDDTYVTQDYFNGEDGAAGSAVLMGRSSNDIEIGKQEFDTSGPVKLKSGIKITNGTSNTIEIGNYTDDDFYGIQVSNGGKSVTVAGLNKDVTIVDGDITTAGKVQATKLELSDGASTPTITEATAIDNAGTVMTAAPADGKTLASTLTVYNNVQDATVFKAAEVTANTHNYAAGDTVKQAIASLDGVVGDIHTYTSSHYANPTADDKDLSTAIKNLDTALFNVTEDYVTKTYFDGGDDTNHYISMGSLAKKVTIGADNSARIVLDVTDDANKSITMTAGTDMQVAVNGTEITIGDKDGQGIKVDNDGLTTTFAGSTAAKKVVVEEGVVTASDGVVVGDKTGTAYAEIEDDTATFKGANGTVTIADGTVTAKKFAFSDTAYATGIDNTGGVFTAAPADNYTIATTKTVYDNTYLTSAATNGNYAAGSVLNAVKSIDTYMGNLSWYNGTHYANTGSTKTSLAAAIKNMDTNVFAKVGTVDLSGATNYANTTATPADNLTEAVVNIDSNVKKAIDDLDGKFVTKAYFNNGEPATLTDGSDNPNAGLVSMGSGAKNILIGKTATDSSTGITSLKAGLAVDNDNGNVMLGRVTQVGGADVVETGVNIEGDHVSLYSANGLNSVNGIDVDKTTVKMGIITTDASGNEKFAGVTLNNGVMTNINADTPAKKSTLSSEALAITDGTNTSSVAASGMAVTNGTDTTLIGAGAISASDGTKTASLDKTGVAVTDGTNTSSMSATGMAVTDGTNTSSMAATGVAVTDGTNTTLVAAGAISLTDTDNTTGLSSTGLSVVDENNNQTLVGATGMSVTDGADTTTIAAGSVTTKEVITDKLTLAGNSATAIDQGTALDPKATITDADKTTLASNATVKASINGIVADIEKQIHGDPDHPETPVTIGEYADNTIIGKVSTDTTKPLNTNINVDTANNKITLETADISNDKQTSTGIELDNAKQTIDITSANGKLGTETGLKITNEGADDQHLIELTYTHKGQDDKVDTERGLVMDADNQTYSLGSTDVAGKTFSGLNMDAAGNTYALGKGTVDDQGKLTLDYGMTMDAEHGVTTFADKDGNGVTMNKGDMTVTDSATVGSVDETTGELSGVKLDKAGNAQASNSATVGQVKADGSLDGNGVQMKNDGSAKFSATEGAVTVEKGGVIADNNVTVGDNTSDDYIDMAKQTDGSYKATFASADGNVEIAGGSITADNKVTADEIEAKTRFYVGDPAGAVTAMYQTGIVSKADEDNQSTYGATGLWTKAASDEATLGGTGLRVSDGTNTAGVSKTGSYAEMGGQKASYSYDGIWIENTTAKHANLNEAGLGLVDGTKNASYGIDGLYVTNGTDSSSVGPSGIHTTKDMYAEGAINGKDLVARESFTLAGTTVHAIDDSNAKINDFSGAGHDVDTLATTSSIYYNAEDSLYTPQQGTYTTVDATTINEALTAVDNIIGNFPDGLNYDNHNLDNGGQAKPENIVDAFNNIDATLGQIHGLAAKLESEGTYMGNLAEGTTVENHLTALDASIGNRRAYTQQNVIKNNESTAKSLDALDMAVGDISKLQGTTYASADNLSDAVVQIDDKLQNLDGRMERAEKDLKDVHHELRRGMASMAAMSALVPNSRSTGKTSLSLGTGAYSGHNAVAVGGFHYLTDNLMLNAGAAWSNSRDAVYRVGVTYSF